MWFQWTDSPTVTLDTPGADIVHVVGSPCIVAERMPEVTRIVASHRLADDRLSEVGTFTWGGAPRFVYAVDRDQGSRRAEASTPQPARPSSTTTLGLLPGLVRKGTV